MQSTAEQSPSKLNADEFNALFFHVKRNRAQIWHDMSRLVAEVAKGIHNVSADDMDDLKGDALALAMETVDALKYDPTRKTAKSYFYSVIRNHMIASASKLGRSSHLGESDVDIAFDDVKGIQPHDAAQQARRHCPNNWKTFRVRSPRDQFVVKKFFRAARANAMKATPNNAKLNRERRSQQSQAERAVQKIIMEALRQCERALLGETS